MSCHDTSLCIATRYSVVDLPLFDAHDARLRPPPSIGRMSQEEEELEAEVAAEERAEAVYGGRTPTGGRRRASDPSGSSAFDPSGSSDPLGNHQTRYDMHGGGHGGGGHHESGGHGGGGGGGHHESGGHGGHGGGAPPAPEHSSDGSEAANRGDGGGRGIAAQGGEGAAVFDTGAALLLTHDAAGAPHGGAHLPRLAHYPTTPSPPLLAAAASAREHEHSGPPLPSPASAHGDERPKALGRSISEVRQPPNVKHDTTTRDPCVKRELYTVQRTTYTVNRKTTTRRSCRRKQELRATPSSRPRLGADAVVGGARARGGARRHRARGARGLQPDGGRRPAVFFRERGRGEIRSGLQR